MAELRLLQLSDCHLSADPEARYRGQDADAGLAAMVEAASSFAPDALVLTGDLAEDGSPAAYARLVERLSDLSLPVAWLPGNHDEREVMQQPFEAAGFLAGPLLDWGGWQIALLDSTWPGRHDGEVDESRLAVLEELDDSRPAAVFIHHQPVAARARWIDKVALVDGESFQARVAGSRAVRLVAFGHVHQAYRRQVDKVSYLAAPSTVANSLPGTDKFTLDPGGPAARWFVLRADGSFDTGILGSGQ